MRAYFDALTEREFRNLYFARAFSLFGDGLVLVALAFAVLETQRSASALGYVLAAKSLALVGFLLVAGVVADRIPRRAVLISSDLVRFAAQGAMAGLLISGNAHLFELIVLAFVYGLGDAFFRPTSTGIVPQTISPERLQQANALIGLTSSTFSVVGPVVAGVLVATVGPGWALAADAATFLISAGFISRLRSISPTSGREPFLRQLREGWSVFTSRTWLWVDGIFSALGSFAVLAPFWALGPVIAQRSLGGASAWSAILAGFGAGSVVGGFLLLRVKPARPLVAAVVPLMLLALPTGLLAGTAPTALIAVGAFAGGLGLAVFNTLFETTVQMAVPPESLSRVASIDWMLSGSLMPLGFAVAGPVAGVIGVRETLAVSAVWIVVSSTVVLAVPAVRNFRREPAARESALGVEPV